MGTSTQVETEVSISFIFNYLAASLEKMLNNYDHTDGREWILVKIRYKTWAGNYIVKEFLGNVKIGKGSVKIEEKLEKIKTIQGYELMNWEILQGSYETDYSVDIII